MIPPQLPSGQRQNEHQIILEHLSRPYLRILSIAITILLIAIKF